jgi:hypothetical protein
MMLTEPEVAERLRCSTSKIKRLRLSGQLPYLPGRPLLIAEEDLEAFISARKRSATAATPPEGQGEANDARGWALAQILGKDLAVFIADGAKQKEEREAKGRALRAPMDAKRWAQIAVLLRPEPRSRRKV